MEEYTCNLQREAYTNTTTDGICYSPSAKSSVLGCARKSRNYGRTYLRTLRGAMRVADAICETQ